MDLIHADAQFHEKGVIDFVKFDAKISLETQLEDNDWEAEIPADDLGRYDLQIGDYLYVPGTEWGGRVEKLVHVSDKGIIRICGANWRGMLLRKIISPPAGQSHQVFTAKSLAEIITALLEPFGGLYELVLGESSDEAVVYEQKKFRYQNVLEAISDMLTEHNDRLELRLDPDSGKVLLYIRSVQDRSAEMELSEDYDLSYTSTRADAQINHMIALGRGEQENRTVRHLYLLPDGSVTENPAAQGVATGVNERAMVYDYPNYDSEAELVRGAKKRLLKYGRQDLMEFDFDSGEIDLPLGDKVGIRDRLIDMASVKTVTEKLLTVSAEGIVLKYQVK